MAKIIIIEGSRNVGKTFLIDKVKDIVSIYKFPFVKYFNESFTNNIPDNIKQQFNDKRELFFLTLGYDITILDLMKKGLIKHDLIVDRGILSDIVFGLQSKRITENDAINAWKWLMNEYGQFFEIVYITSNNKEDNRNKDAWCHYNNTENVKLSIDFLKNVNYEPCIINNSFNNKSVENFRKCIIDLII